jgi:DNA polymerase-1
MPKKENEVPTLVLLDAHAILHRAYHALPDFASPSGDPTGALYGVTTMLLRIIEDFNPQYLAACYDLPQPTYRHDAYDAYKSGRRKTDPALVSQIERSRDLMKAFGVPIYEKVGFEADDILGTIAHLTRDTPVRVIIASGDMDTLQCIDKKRVEVFTLKRGLNDTVIYDEAGVKHRFGFGPKLVPDYKGLRGDPSDNIPGVPGIGEKTATTLISSFGSLEKIYEKLQADEQQFLDAGIKPRIINLLKEHQEEAEFSKMLATIRTDAMAEFELIDTEWKVTGDIDALLQLFQALGFRNLGDRVKRLYDSEVMAMARETERESASERDIQEAAILLWLVDSERTNASYDDVVEYGAAFLSTQGFTDTKQALLQLVTERGLLDLYQTIELPLIDILSAMKRRGILVDTRFLETFSQELHQELVGIEALIHEHAGEVFNINSPKQLGNILYDKLALATGSKQKKTAGGKRSTAEAVLDTLRDEHPIIAEILRYRELSKILSTYVDALPEQTGDDGRVHSTLLQTGTATGRMASRDPNLQNIPVRTVAGRKVRQAFVATPGYTLVAIDYSQIELRIAAMLSGDQALIEIFKNGEDVHAGAASRVFGVPLDQVADNMRRQAKVINFGILYGMGVNALRTNLGEDTTRAEAAEYLAAYFATFSGLASFLDQVKSDATSAGYTSTMLGRRRYFPALSSNVPYLRAGAERAAINAPIQGTSGDAMRIAMRDIANWIDISGQVTDVRLLLQVHDELIFEVRSDLLDQTIPTLVELMQQVLSEQDTKGVPVIAEVKTGQNWFELEPYPST